MQEERGISLYIHIPFCVSKCRYCDFFSKGGNSAVPEPYVQALCAEIKKRSYTYNAFSQWKSIYIGGGTPSLLTREQLQKILNAALSAKKITPKTEVTIELNPDDITKELLLGLESTAINRISVGIQSLNQKSLEFAGRRADAQTNVFALEEVHKYWRRHFSADLICGLPFETEDSFVLGLEKLVSYNPDHISMYSLTFEDETAFGKLLKSKKLDYDFDAADSLWLKGREILEKNGFLQYEVSNFCKKGFESRHNLCYWNHEPYIGCGSGGCGTVYNPNGSAFRWTNCSDPKEYSDFWNGGSSDSVPQEKEEIDVRTSVLEYFMMGLRKTGGVLGSDFYRTFGFEIPECVKRLAQKWQSGGLCTVNSSGRDFDFTLGKTGILYLNRFIVELFALEGEL